MDVVHTIDDEEADFAAKVEPPDESDPAAAHADAGPSPSPAKQADLHVKKTRAARKPAHQETGPVPAAGLKPRPKRVRTGKNQADMQLTKAAEPLKQANGGKAESAEPIRQQPPQEPNYKTSDPPQ